MAFMDFLDHTCDIYHATGTNKTPGYGLPSSPEYSYPKKADEADVQCHFAQGGSGGTINTLVQNLPEHSYEDRIKLTLPIGTDVRRNDKIIDHRTGLEYYAELPRIIRNHHIYVWVKREGTEVAI